MFEVPYNFSLSLIRFYAKHSTKISFLFLPPYKDDSINSRTSIETKKKGRCYTPQSREEYEYHLHEIVNAGLRFVVLWQVPGSTISEKTLSYYCGLGTSGFIIANDENAKIVKEYDPKLLVIGSLVQRIYVNMTKRDFRYYDKVILYYPFNRSLNALKQLAYMKDKIVLMPNALCHIDCPSIHHWFPSDDHPFVLERDCWVLRNKEDYVDKCGFISPEHLYLFDNYVGGYKLQGRESSTDLIKYVCGLYFERKSPAELINAMLGDELSLKIQDSMSKMSPDGYYNVNTKRAFAVI